LNRGDQLVFIELYDQYYDRVRKFILTLVKDEWVADDLIQETFVRVNKNMDTVRDPDKISSWIFRIAYNLCQDHFKSMKRSVLKSSKTTEPSFEIPVMKKIEQQEMGDCVQDKMNMLPESMRTILVLFDIMEFSHKEIAEILSLSEENTKVRLHRARKQFKSILKEKCTFERDERNVLVCEPSDQKE
jgi:RNA polymerase sigma-70 factor, ECF subfamily